MSKENAAELPVGWKREELRFENRYVYQNGEAMVRVQKAGTREPFRLDVSVYGVVTWSGFEEEKWPEFKPLNNTQTLSMALRMAEDILENPKKHLNAEGVRKVEEAKQRYLGDVACRLDVNKLPPSVRSALRERGHTDTDVAFMSPREAFDEYCTWHGLVRWGDTLWENAKALMAFEPKPSQSPGLSPAVLAEMQGFRQPPERERDMLAGAIRDAAVKAGIIRADVEALSGPELLMLCNDLANSSPNDKEARQISSGDDPSKVVVMMSGGVVEDVLVSGNGISVAVVEHDKNADLDRQIVIPDEDGEEGYALASIREPVVNPGRVEELFSAVEEARPAAECEGALRP